MNKQEKINWIISKHEDTNHMYDVYLPYKFHLLMVVEVFKRFKYLLDSSVEGDIEDALETIELAAWGHDLIEDTRTSYSDVSHKLGKSSANIIYALTNEKGRNREERANDRYYDGIRSTPYATFVKLCDRIANVQYGKMMGTSMFTKYKKENDHFMRHLGYIGIPMITNTYKPMFEYLIDLFNKES